MKRKHGMTTEQLREQSQAKAFLDFVDRVALALYGRVYDDLSKIQRADVLGVTEAIHMWAVN
jgi:hypothetical protein